MLAQDDSWMTSAACRSLPNADDVFFPARNQERATDYAQARLVCHECPVLRECLAFAIYHKERYGMWGGFTPAERRRLPIDIRRKLRRWWSLRYGRR